MVKPISVVIAAEDKATGVIDKVNRGFADFNRRTIATGAETERFSKTLDKVGDGSGPSRVATGIGEIGRRISGAAESLGRFAPALAGISSAASVAGIAKLVETWTTFGARLGLDANRIGMSAQSLHGLQNAARLAGTSGESLTDGMRTLGDNLMNAAGGRSADTVVMLNTMGIAFRDSATGGSRLAKDVLPEIARAISAIPDPAMRAMLATKAFGGAGEAMLPFIMALGTGTAATREEMERYGLVNDKGVQAAKAMAQAQQRIGLAVEGLGYSVSERLAPVLVPMLDRLSAWIAAHHEDVAAFFDRVAKGIERWVDSGGFDSMLSKLVTFGQSVVSIAGTVDTVVQALGGWQVAAEVLLTFMAGRWAMGMVGSIGRVTGALGGMRAAMPQGGAMAGSAGRGILGTLGAGSMIGTALDLMGGRTEQDMHAFNVDSPLAQMGRMMGEFLGMKFDSEGRSEGLLSRWTNGLGGPRGGGSGGGATPALPQGEQAVRARTAFDLLRSLGNSPSSAAGRVANMHVESGFNERAIGDGGEAFGIGQWHRDRQAQFTARYGHDMQHSTFEEQVRFFNDDPDAQSQRAARMLRNNPGMPAYDAAGIITGLQERPADVAGESHRRGVLAEQYERRFRDEDAARARAAPPMAAAPPQAAPPVAAPPPPLAPPVAPPPGPQANAAPLNGTVGVNVAFLNPPPGLRHTTTTEGNVTVRAPRIDYAMPGWAPV